MASSIAYADSKSSGGRKTTSRRCGSIEAIEMNELRISHSAVHSSSRVRTPSASWSNSVGVEYFAFL